MKPRRGNCGSCHWFECGPVHPAQVNGAERQGICMVAPPIAVAVNQQSGLAAPGRGPQLGSIGLRPPTGENGRCAQWRPAGVLPDAVATAGGGTAGAVSDVGGSGGGRN